MSGEKERSCSGLQIKYKGWGQMKCCFWLWCCGWASVQVHLAVVGGFAPRAGVNVNNNNYDNDNIGVVPGRPAEILLLSLLSFKNSVGDGLYPPANHPSNFLNHDLNLKI